jgi:hypothetical protein
MRTIVQIAIDPPSFRLTSRTSEGRDSDFETLSVARGVDIE